MQRSNAQPRNFIPQKTQRIKGKDRKISLAVYHQRSRMYYKTISVLIYASYHFQNILTHSRSRVVLQTMVEAKRQGKNFHVFVTISAPDNSG